MPYKVCRVQVIDSIEKYYSAMADYQWKLEYEIGLKIVPEYPSLLFAFTDFYAAKKFGDTHLIDYGIFECDIQVGHFPEKCSYFRIPMPYYKSNWSHWWENIKNMNALITELIDGTVLCSEITLTKLVFRFSANVWL